jgi:leucyl-tRNA synthetase
MVLAPEHPLVSNSELPITNKEEVEKYAQSARNKTDIERSALGKEKTGVELKGVKAINPATKEEVPMWVADYVLPHYGTGVIMAVPADDERDKEFAQKFNLPVVEDYQRAGFEDYGKKVTHYKLRDWVVSRQRYWGVPIPVIHCKKCGAVSVPEDQLPVLLPEIEDYLPRDDGKSPLSKVREWVEVKCPKCGGQAERETDTLDTFVDSSWYYLRYTDPNNTEALASSEKMDKWMPVDLYSGGAEHTTMHLLYSRFWHKVLFDLGLVKDNEPYLKRVNRGLILGPDGQKMSKSRGNVIDPDKEVERLGADAMRLYLAFIGPYNVPGNYPWNLNAAIGTRRFLERIWFMADQEMSDESGHNNVLMNQTIKKVSEDIAAMKFNTAISSLMIWLKEHEKSGKGFSKTQFETLLLLLAPFAPHITEELWSLLGHQDSIHLQKWPEYDPKLILEEQVVIAIQIDGRLRGTIEVPRDSKEEHVKSEALALAEVQKWLKGEAPKKIIIIPNRLISLVT